MSEPSRRQRSDGRLWLLSLAAFLLALGAFAPLILYRNVDPDEGFYAFAAELAWNGRMPYRDFLFPQMPLLPYVLGGWLYVFGPTWGAARLLSSVMSALAALGVAVYVWRHTRSTLASGIGLLLFVGSGLVLHWAAVVHTYPYSIAASVWCLVALDVWSSGRLEWRWLAVAGVLAGAAAGMRLLYIPFLLVVLLFVAARSRADGAGAAAARLAVCAGACALPLLPAVMLLLLDRDAFLFGNLEFHALRSPSGLVGSITQKAMTVREFLMLKQELLLLCLGMVSVTAVRLDPLRRPAASLLLVAASAVVLWVVSLLPTPTYVQYFVVIVALLIMMMSRLLGQVARAPVWVRVTAVSAVAAYCLVGAAAASRMGCQVDNCLSTVRDVRDQVTRRTDVSGVVMASWPGYVFGSQRSLLTGMENHGRVEILDRLGEAQARTFHVTSDPEVLAALRARPDAVGVFGPFGSTHRYSQSVLDWVSAAAPCLVPTWQRGNVVLLEHRRTDFDPSTCLTPPGPASPASTASSDLAEGRGP